MIQTSKRFFSVLYSLNLIGGEIPKKIYDIIKHPLNYDFISNHANYLDLGNEVDEVSLIHKKNIREGVDVWKSKSRMSMKIGKLLKNLVNPYDYPVLTEKDIEKFTTKYKQMVQSVKKSQEVKVNRNQLNRLMKIVSIQSFHSGEEDMMDNYIINFIRGLKGVTYQIETDEYGNKNFFITKGKTKNYPCVVAHKDTVHKIIDKYKVYHVGDTIFAIDGSNITQYGTGGDDKVGIFVTLQLLLELPNIKVAFFHNEEIGQIGSYNSNKDFFSNVGYVLQADRKGNEDIVRFGDYTELFSDEQELLLTPIFDKWKYKVVTGSKTDVVALKREGVNVLMLNASCGYHKPHTKEEVIQISEVFNTLGLFKDIIKHLGNKRYYHKDKFKFEQYFGDMPDSLNMFKDSFKCSECKQKPFAEEGFNCTKCSTYKIEEKVVNTNGQFLGVDVVKIKIKEDLLNSLDKYKQTIKEGVKIVNILLIANRIGYPSEMLKENFNNFVSFSRKQGKLSFLKNNIYEDSLKTATPIVDGFQPTSRKASEIKEFLENTFSSDFLKDLELKTEDYDNFTKNLNFIKTGQTQIEFNKNIPTTVD
jgi:hypothetical protein